MTTRTRTHTFTHTTTLPLQALLIAPDPELRRRILSGEKEVTIRAGWRSYRLGPVMLCCHLEPWCVEAEIMSVHCTLLRHLRFSDAVIQGEGCEDYEGLRALLRRFYPDIDDDSPVTVIHFSNLTGKLTEGQPVQQRPLNLSLAADIAEGRGEED